MFGILCLRFLKNCSVDCIGTTELKCLVTISRGFFQGVRYQQLFTESCRCGRNRSGFHSRRQGPLHSRARLRRSARPRPASLQQYANIVDNVMYLGIGTSIATSAFTWGLGCKDIRFEKKLNAILSSDTEGGELPLHRLRIRTVDWEDLGPREFKGQVRRLFFCLLVVLSLPCTPRFLLSNSFFRSRSIFFV